MVQAFPRGRVLIIAGSDSGGGAGIQADIKTVTMLGGYAATAVTAVTVQNTMGVTGVHMIPPQIVADQIVSVLSDIGADAVKIGMLGEAGTVNAVANALAKFGDIPLILDPVMVAKGGAKLFDRTSLDALKLTLLKRALVITPNLPEAEVLTGRRIRDVGEMRAAIPALRALGPKTVFLKGGHLAGTKVVDMLADGGALKEWREPKLQTQHTHGTGCTMASAIATGVAQGLDLVAAVERARVYVRRAIETAPGFGRGNGPLNHLHPLASSGK